MRCRSSLLSHAFTGHTFRHPHSTSRMSLSLANRATVALLVFGAAVPVAAQQPRAVTADDYARAERFLAPWTMPLVSGAGVRPAWLANDRFWYRTTNAGGS